MYFGVCAALHALAGHAMFSLARSLFVRLATDYSISATTFLKALLPLFLLLLSFLYFESK